MFNHTKFKKGEIVLLLSDLSYQFEVKNVYIENGIEMVVIDNDTAVTADSLTYYSAPLIHLDRKNKQLLKELNNTKSANGIVFKELNDKYATLNGKFTELKDKIIKKDTSGIFYVYQTAWNNILGGNKEEVKPEPKTLEERIEELEAKLAKKTKTPKVVLKSKSKKIK